MLKDIDQKWGFKAWHFDNTSLWALWMYAHKYRNHISNIKENWILPYGAIRAQMI